MSNIKIESEYQIFGDKDASNAKLMLEFAFLEELPTLKNNHSFCCALCGRMLKNIKYGKGSRYWKGWRFFKLNSPPSLCTLCNEGMECPR